MDYKELIRLLRDESNCDVLDYIDDAATAIETLMAEREAALSKCRGECDECAHADRDADDFPCCDCCYACMDWDKSDHWKWRGPIPIESTERTEE